MSKKKIMVIDDNATNLNIARKVLETDYEVILILNGQKALDILSKKVPDLILLDIMMPEMNGFELIEKIKNLGSPYNKIPVIFLTGQDDATSEVNGFELGAVDYITKPFSFSLLLKRVELHLKLDLQRKQLQDYSLSLENNVIELENKNSLNNTMLECVKTLVNDDTLEASMNKLLKIITNYYDGTATKIFYKEQVSENINCSYSYVADKDNDNTKHGSSSIQYIIDLFNHFEKDGVGYISSVELMKDVSVHYESFKRNKVNSLLFVPLLHSGQIVGFLGVQNLSKNLDDFVIIKTISAFVVDHIYKNNLLNKLERLSYNDTLTNLYNRNYYNNYINEYEIKSNNKIGVIFSDVNGLKVANDTHGHEFGDTLIKSSAKFLKDNIDGLIFRIGGDEFVGILDGVEKSDFDDFVINLKNKIDTSNNINISIGSTWKENFDNIEKVIINADIDMYNNKKIYYANKLKEFD